MTRHPWWYDKVKKDQLSGGDFISNWSDKRPGEATYAFRASSGGKYVFWVRANPVATKLSYQLDGGRWQLIDMKSPQENINIADDGKIDLRFIAWIKVGTVHLTKGAHSIKFKMHSDNNNHGMLDCFVFANGPFTPEGKRKPGEKSAASEVAAEGRWAFQPPRDEFSPRALLDLRSLNEKFAGEHGFVTRVQRRQRLRLRRRHARALLGGQRRGLRQGPPAPCPLPRQARHQHGALSQQHHAYRQRPDGHRPGRPRPPLEGPGGDEEGGHLRHLLALLGRTGSRQAVDGRPRHRAAGATGACCSSTRNCRRPTSTG